MTDERSEIHDVATKAVPAPKPTSIWRSDDEDRIPDSTAIAIAAGVPLGLVILLCSGCGGLLAFGNDPKDAGGAEILAGFSLMAIFSAGVISFAMAICGYLPRLFWALLIAAICGCLAIFVSFWIAEIRL